MPAGARPGGGHVYDLDACRAWLAENPGVLAELEEAAGKTDPRSGSGPAPVDEGDGGDGRAGAGKLQGGGSGSGAGADGASSGAGVGDGASGGGGGGGGVRWAHDVIGGAVSRLALGEDVDAGELDRALAVAGVHRSVLEARVAGRRAELRSEARAALAERGAEMARQVRADAEAEAAELAALIDRKRERRDATARRAALLERGVGVEVSDEDLEALEAELASIDADCDRSKDAYVAFKAHRRASAEENERTERELKATWERLKSERVSIASSLESARNRRRVAGEESR